MKKIFTLFVLFVCFGLEANAGCPRAISGTLTFCTGDSTLLTEASTGPGYQWYINGTIIPGATAQTYSVTQAGYYNCMVTDACGTDSSGAGVSVVENPLPLVNVGNDTTTCGTPVVLDAGNPDASYIWCDGSTTQMITFYTSGSCMVFVTATNGCTNSDTITVIINIPPTVTLTSPNDSLCPAGPPMTLTPSPSGGTLTGPGISGNTFTAFNAGPGTHTINYVYTDANGCSASASLMLTVFPIPNISMNVSSSTVCLDDANVTLTGTPSGGFFTGTGVSGTSFDPSAAGNGTFNITYIFQDTNGCNFATILPVTVNACVGITEQAAVNGTSLFPNPSSGDVTISINASSSVMIFNTLGESVLSVQLAQGNHAIDMAGFAEGIYFVRTQNINGVSTQRLIISR